MDGFRYQFPQRLLETRDKLAQVVTSFEWVVPNEGQQRKRNAYNLLLVGPTCYYLRRGRDKLLQFVAWKRQIAPNCGLGGSNCYNLFLGVKHNCASPPIYLYHAPPLGWLTQRVPTYNIFIFIFVYAHLRTLIPSRLHTCTCHDCAGISSRGLATSCLLPAWMLP